MEAHRVRGTVPLLADDQLSQSFERRTVGHTPGLAAFIRRTLVVLGTEEKHHDVRILLDGSRFAEVRELWTPVLPGTLFRRARELGQRDHRNAELAGERLERAGDVADLLLAVLRVRRTGDELQVVDDHHPDLVLDLEPSGARTNVERGEARAVVDP